MPNPWSFSHPAVAVSAIRSTTEVTVAAPAPSSSQWAADLAATMRLMFAQQCQRFPGRVTNLSFTANLDSSGSLTISMSTS